MGLNFELQIYCTDSHLVFLLQSWDTHWALPGSICLQLWWVDLTYEKSFLAVPVQCCTEFYVFRFQWLSISCHLEAKVNMLEQVASCYLGFSGDVFQVCDIWWNSPTNWLLWTIHSWHERHECCPGVHWFGHLLLSAFVWAFRYQNGCKDCVLISHYLSLLWLSSQLPHLFTHLGAQFCRSAVEPMGEESDHVHITALSDALGVPVRVVYLDRSGDTDDKPAEVNHHDFIPVGSPQTTVDPFVVLLYRPGHYDILYTKQE